jgi:hypothetical protein
MMIWLIFAHCFGDSVFQTSWQSQNKNKLWYAMLSHCLTWTACISIALQYFGLFSMWKVFFLIVGHWICDKWNSSKPKIEENKYCLYIDQLWHLIQCCVVYLF